MLFTFRALVGFVLVVWTAACVDARQWTDVTGKYSIEADLIAFNEDSVIIQRADKELGTVAIDQLSEADREYLQSKEAMQAHTDHVGKTQTWTTKGGLNVVGRIVDYTRPEVTLQRRRGKTYVNNTVFKNLPEVYQRMLPKIVEHLESVDIPDGAALEKWVKSLRGQPRVYNLVGVILELENGDEYSVPFFLLSEKDQQILKPGWESWLNDHDDYEKREDHAFQLQSIASAYQQDQQINRRIAIMNLQTQAIRAGLTSAWEVTLYPVRGNNSPPRWVVMMGRSSLDATNAALQQYPGYVSGPVRKISP